MFQTITLSVGSTDHGPISRAILSAKPADQAAIMKAIILASVIILIGSQGALADDASSDNELGISAYRARDYKQAINYYQRAVSEAKSLDTLDSYERNLARALRMNAANPNSPGKFDPKPQPKQQKSEDGFKPRYDPQKQALDQLESFYVMEIFSAPTDAQIDQTVEKTVTRYNRDGSSYLYSYRGAMQAFEQDAQRLKADYTCDARYLEALFKSGKTLFTLQGGWLMATDQPMEETYWRGTEVVLKYVTNKSFRMARKVTLEEDSNAYNITVQLAVKQ